MARGVLWYVFVGSRGGDTRICLVELLLERPRNARELALALGVDYSTARHSLRVLEKNRIAFVPERGYGAKYLLTPEFMALRDEFERIRERHACMRKGGGAMAPVKEAAHEKK